MPKNSPWLAEESATAGGKNSATAGGTICNRSAEKICHAWWKNPPHSAEILTLEEIFALTEYFVLCPVTIFLENSAAGRLWSSGMPSLAWNYLESFLQ